MGDNNEDGNMVEAPGIVIEDPTTEETSILYAISQDIVTINTEVTEDPTEVEIENSGADIYNKGVSVENTGVGIETLGVQKIVHKGENDEDEDNNIGDG